MRADLTDEDLMAMFQGGDALAFDLLFEAYRGRLFGFLCVATGERMVAEEALVEVFRRVVRLKENYSPPRPFRTWVYGLAVGASREAVNGRGPIHPGVEHLLSPRVATAQGHDLEAIANGGGAEARVLRRLDDEEFRERTRIAVAGLPEPDREAFILHEVERMGETEAAEVLGEGRETVRAALVRARRVVIDLVRDPWTA